MTNPKKETIHTSRTIMFDELSKVMDHAAQDDTYLGSLNENIANKKTKSNQLKTARYLKQLYDFNNALPCFQAFKYFWKITDHTQKPLIALLYAINKDYLLIESIPVVASTRVGEKVAINFFQNNLEQFHPGRFSEKTRLSVAQNIASTWKQAGFITGKVKNIRTQPAINHQVLTFAFLLAYLAGERGDFIFTSKWVKSLFLPETVLRQLAAEAARNGLMQYQFAGHVTTISFTDFLKKAEIDVI